jgi:hypothetical protein
MREGGRYKINRSQRTILLRSTANFYLLREGNFDLRGHSCHSAAWEQVRVDPCSF